MLTHLSQSQNQQILLLMDNAPLHILADLTLTNIKVQTLPPNTTSKVQPMDAGIISAFKRRNRRFHLQNALDQDERNELNLYKVDQLTAMRWSLVAWSDISATTIRNCFRHIGLMDGPVTLTKKQEAGTGTAGSMEEQLVEQELEAALKRLPLRNSMSLAYLLNPEEEDESAYQELTDAEIMKLVQGSDEEEENTAVEEVDRFSKAEKLDSLSLTISLLDLSLSDHCVAHRVLRKLQFDLRTASTTQTTLDSWLQ